MADRIDLYGAFASYLRKEQAGSHATGSWDREARMYSASPGLNFGKYSAIVTTPPSMVTCI